MSRDARDAAGGADDISAVAALDDPVRRALHRHVAEHPTGVNRDQAAQAMGMSRAVAAYHLDRLAEAGLLEVSHERPPGRGGPGAGRPAKIYRRAARTLEVSFPPRNYELAARLLLTAADPAGQATPSPGLTDAARATGRGLGRRARERSGPRPSRRRLLDALRTELTAKGFDPEQRGDTLTLRNCPFHALAQSNRDLVCGMNLALLEGIVDGAGVPGAAAVLDPAPGRCCVVIRTTSR